LGIRDIAPIILSPRHYMKASSQLHAPAVLSPRKKPLYPLDRRLDGPQSRSGRGGEDINSQPQPGIEIWIPDRPTRSLVAIQIWISRLN